MKLFIITLFFLAFASVLSQVPKEISYQGLIQNSDGSTIENGNYNLTFRIYTSQTGGEALWEETQQVSVENGIFDVHLGKIQNFDLTIFRDNEDLYLEMSFGGNAMTRVK